MLSAGDPEGRCGKGLSAAQLDEKFHQTNELGLGLQK